MTWLFLQFWLLLFIAFALGGLVTWLLIKALLPHVDEVDGTVVKEVA